MEPFLPAPEVEVALDEHLALRVRAADGRLSVPFVLGDLRYEFRLGPNPADAHAHWSEHENGSRFLEGRRAAAPPKLRVGKPPPARLQKVAPGLAGFSEAMSLLPF